MKKKESVTKAKKKDGKKFALIKKRALKDGLILFFLPPPS